MKQALPARLRRLCALGLCLALVLALTLSLIHI